MAAESSPALLSDTVAGLSSEARAHWQMTGEVPDSTVAKPERKARTPKPASSTGEPATQAEEIASSTPAVSETAPSKETRGNASTRNAELDAEITELKDKLKLRAQLRDEEARTRPVATSATTDAKTAPPSGAADATPIETLLARPDINRPPMDEDAFFAAYPKATLGQFTRYQTRYDTLSYQAEQSRNGILEAGRTRYQTHFNTAREADPEIASKLPKAFMDASPVIHARSGPLDFVAREIQTSEHGAALLQYLGDHPEAFSKLQAAPDAASVIREMARLEARVSNSTSTSTTPAPKKAEISSAPEPTTSLGRRSAVPADESLSAVSAGNVRGYMDAENRKATQRRFGK
jgi:hypothetical protein